MMRLSSLYHYAEQEHIDVDFRSIPLVEALSMPLPDGTCTIAIDPEKLSGTADETEKLAHELGHCMTGSFYSRYAPLDERGRCETRAMRWAIRRVLPYKALRSAMEQGLTEPAQLAEYFEVPEHMVREAIGYYTGPCGLEFYGQDREDAQP